jgi:PAS domain S-box-containing protein
MVQWKPQIRNPLSPTQSYGLAVVSVGGALFMQRFPVRDVQVPFFLSCLVWRDRACRAGASTRNRQLRPLLHRTISHARHLTCRSPLLHCFCLIRIAGYLVQRRSTPRRGRASSSSRQPPNRGGGTNPAGQPAESHSRHPFRPGYERRHDITYWNRGAQELYGWTAEEATGKRAHELLQTVFPAPIDDIRAELLRSGRWDGELEKTKADGTKVIVASRWSLRRDDLGRPAAILETNNDVTERRRREEEIRTLNEELGKRSAALEASHKELEAFAYSISHDLRAPLRHMSGFTELLQKNMAALLNEKSKRYMMMILESAKKMGNLIDDLLAFSRIGRAEAHKATVSLEHIVQEVLTEVRQETAGRNIVWKLGKLPAWYGDRSMLRLALVNLISNAVKFIRTRPQAEIEIGCTDQKRDQVVLFIRDNGVGFDMKYVNKLFGVFQRLHPTEAFEGTGIGLATVQRIVHRHGGTVWAEGLVDRGATFLFLTFQIAGSLTYEHLGTYLTDLTG